MAPPKANAAAPRPRFWFEPKAWQHGFWPDHQIHRWPRSTGRKKLRDVRDPSLGWPAGSKVLGKVGLHKSKNQTTVHRFWPQHASDEHAREHPTHRPSPWHRKENEGQSGTNPRAKDRQPLGQAVVDQEQAGPRIEAVSAKNPCASQGIQSSPENDKSPKRARATPGQQHQHCWPKSGVDPQPNLSQCGIRPQPTFRQTPANHQCDEQPKIVAARPARMQRQPETSRQSQSSRKQTTIEAVPKNRACGVHRHQQPRWKTTISQSRGRC